MPTPTHIVWLVANEPEVSRVGPGHTNIPQENRFSLRLRKELLKADILTVLGIGIGIGTKVHSAEQLCSRSCTKELHSVFLPFHNQVVGIMLVKAADSFNIFSCLSSAQRCVSEYWTATMHSEHPRLLLQCVAAARLEQPFSVRSTKQSAAAKMFFRCTWATSRVINFYPNMSAICVRAHCLSFCNFHISQNLHLLHGHDFVFLSDCRFEHSHV